MGDHTLADQSARDIIEQNTDQNLVVLAGAGAGKTHELVGRMVRMIATGTVAAENMAAITFTRKAAGELRARFYSRLREFREDATPDERPRIDQALESFDQCYMGTIHSFCGRILRERPVEAGLPPDFTEIEGRDEAVLRRETWDKFVQGLTREEDERLSSLAELGLEIEELFPFFVRRADYSDLVLKETPVDIPDLKRATEAVEAFVEEVGSHIPEYVSDGPDQCMEMIATAKRFLAFRDNDSTASRIRLLKIASGGTNVTQKRWGDEKAYAKQLKDVYLPEFHDSVTEPVLQQWRQYLYGRVVSIIDDAMAFYDDVRRRSGVLTFQDLLLQAAALLRSHPNVRRFFQNRYQTLLVDEFQDTDPIQAELVFYLAGDDPTEQDWRKIKPRPGSLFVVGDDKQSIYRFRRADIDVFRFVTERVRENGGQDLHLSTSFRSVEGVCDWINHAFEKLGEGGQSEYQADFTPLLKNRAQTFPGSCVHKITVEKVARNNRAQIASVTSERIADFIAAAMEGTSPWNGTRETSALGPKASAGDFLLLTRTKGQLTRYARALEERHIPYDISGGGRLGDNLYIRALADLMEAAIWSENALAFVCYLRGPFVGMGDDELYRFHGRGGRFDQRLLPDNIDGKDSPPLLQEAMDRLARVREWMETRTPVTAVSLIIDDLGISPFSASEEAGSTHAGSLLRLQGLVQKWENRDLHIGQVVTELRDLVSDPDYMVEEMTLEAGSEDVVRIMNIHQAKGLEGKVVFLCDPADSRTARFKPEFHVSRKETASYLALPASKPNGPYASECVAEPVDWAEDAETEARYLAAEELRLVYVAATRARDKLVVCHYAGDSKKGTWTRLYPFLENVPELDHVPPAATVQPGAEMPDLRGIKRETEERWKMVTRATYASSAVTTASQEREAVPSLGAGKGRDYGTLVHDLLEMAVTGRLPKGDLERFIGGLVDQAGISEGLEKDARDAVEAFLGSEIWHEIEVSNKVLCEVPFGVPSREEGLNTILSGRIDLVYRMADGWKMVDYKTDIAPDDVAIEALVQRYSPQVRAYADHWARLTEEPVHEAGLWLTDRTLFKPVV